MKVLPQKSLGLLIDAALPGALGIAEEDAHPRVDPQARELDHLGI